MHRLILFASLTAAVACSSARSPTHPSTQTYTASTEGTGVGVNSHLVLGETEAILVDGQLYRADAEAVVQLVKRSGRHLTTVLLTHAHPDHFLGLAIIQGAFPDAKFVTTRGVLSDYQGTAPAVFAFLKAQLGNAIADSLATIEPLDGDSLVLDGEVLEVLDVTVPTESKHAVALVVPSTSTLIAGDLVYDNVHLYLGECSSSGWLSELATLDARRFETVLAGHGASRDSTAIQRTRRYIADVIPLLASAKASTGDDDSRIAAATALIKAKAPTYRSDYLLGASTKQYLTGCTP